LPVEYFNPLRNVAVAPNLNAEELGRSAHVLGELVGLALRGIRNCPMELNLRPATVVKRHRIAEQRPYIIMAGACALLALAAWWLFFDRGATATEQVIAGMQPELNELKGYESRINAVKSEIAKQDQTAAPYMAAVREREYWVKLIDDINSRLPADNIWVTHFKLEEAKDSKKTTTSSSKNAAPASDEKKVALVLQGLYLENPRGANVVDDFLANLGESPFFAVNKDSMRMRATPRDEDWAFDFAIVVALKNPITQPVTLITTK